MCRWLAHFQSRCSYQVQIPFLCLRGKWAAERLKETIRGRWRMHCRGFSPRWKLLENAAFTSAVETQWSESKWTISEKIGGKENNWSNFEYTVNTKDGEHDILDDNLSIAPPWGTVWSRHAARCCTSDRPPHCLIVSVLPKTHHFSLRPFRELTFYWFFICTNAYFILCRQCIFILFFSLVIYFTLLYYSVFWHHVVCWFYVNKCIF